MKLMIGEIFQAKNRRPLNEDAISTLMASIEKVGLQYPITVREVDYWFDDEQGEQDGAYVLVAGAHRLEACKRLGMFHIEANVEAWDEKTARMWEIAENLHRADLTVLQRDEHVSEWIRLAEKKNTDASHKLSQVATVSKGGRGNQEGVRAAARELNIDKDDAHRAVKVASLSDEAKEAAREVGLDNNRSALLAVAAAKKEEQADKVRELASRRTSTIDADIKRRAAEAAANVIAAYVPFSQIDALKANLYSAGSKTIADALANIVGESMARETV